MNNKQFQIYIVIMKYHLLFVCYLFFVMLKYDEVVNEFLLGHFSVVCNFKRQWSKG